MQAAQLPDQIDLPNGFAPEGIATGRGFTFFTGSLSGAGIWRGDYRTGQGELLVDGGGPFVGMKADARNRLWVAGGDAGSGYVFEASSGELLASFAFAVAPTFINDVVVTRDAAYFTDSFRPALYRVPIGHYGQIGEAETIPLDPAQIGFVEGEFNLNGIDATANGKTLVAVNTSAGDLFTIDPASGEAAEIDIGAASVSFGDGILLEGQTLYVVRNFLNLAAVVELAPDLGTGTYAAELTSPDLSVPTTVARFGSSLFVVNAHFDVPVTPDTEYWITRLDRVTA
jgi:sugar lactone lactonase YvrE